MRGAITLGHVRGIPIRAHFTLLFILPYLAYMMATQFQPVAHQAGVSGTAMLLPPVVWGLLLSIALFVCVLLHELGHSLLALRFGGQVSGITLMLLGGVSELRGLPKGARQEGLIAAAGPLVSLALGVIALGLHHFTGGPPDLRFGLFYLGEINLVLAAFNVIPAFPMDGGRILRSLLEVRWSRLVATRIAAGTGLVFAALFVIAGLFGGNFLLALIGLFVWSGARGEAQVAEQEELVRGLRVRDVMALSTDAAEAAEPVTIAANRMAAAHLPAMPVLDGTELVGVVTAHHLELLKAEEQARLRVEAVTERDVPWLDSDDSLSNALERMAERRAEDAPVLHDGRLVGMLDTSDLGRAIRLRRLSAIKAMFDNSEQRPAAPAE